MSVARATTFTVDGGGDTHRIEVEVDVRAGLPSFTVLGLPDSAVRETRERLRAVILSSGFEFPLRRITVNVAPARLCKVGLDVDLALAVALLAASDQVSGRQISSYAVHGWLSPNGALQPRVGELAVAEGARRAGLRGLLSGSRHYSSVLRDGVVLTAVTTLREVVECLDGRLAGAP